MKCPYGTLKDSKIFLGLCAQNPWQFPNPSFLRDLQDMHKLEMNNA